MREMSQKSACLLKLCFGSCAAAHNGGFFPLSTDFGTQYTDAFPAGALKRHGGQEKQAPGRSRGGFSTKIHIAADAPGNPLKFIPTPGQNHDITQAEALTADFRPGAVPADKGYDSEPYRQYLQDRGIVPVIPPRSCRKNPQDYDRHLYKERHLAECFINKIKHFMRIFSRFDKLPERYLSFLHFAGSLIWLR